MNTGDDDFGWLTALRSGLANWFERYNGWRPHEALGNLTPDMVHRPRPAGTPYVTRTTTPKAA